MNEFNSNYMIFDTNRGKEIFHQIEKLKCGGVNYYLMESCKHGNEVGCIIFSAKGKVENWCWWGTLEEWINQ